MTPPRPIDRDGPCSVLAAHRAVDAGAPRRAPVAHAHATLAFYTDGGARMEQRGEWRLREGDVLLVPAGEPHRALDRRRQAYWELAFSPSSLAAEGAATLLAPFERVRDGGAAVVHVPGARHGFLAELFRELEALAGAAGPEAVRRSLLTLILHEVDRAAGAGVGERTGGGVVAESLRFIERSCLRKISLADVAAAVGRTPAYVTTALTRATGRSAGEWIVSGRMAEARRLLLGSDEPVDAIAARVGYADATHFIRMFRREHGATPAAWRASTRARR